MIDMIRGQQEIQTQSAKYRIADFAEMIVLVDNGEFHCRLESQKSTIAHAAFLWGNSVELNSDLEHTVAIF